MTSVNNTPIVPIDDAEPPLILQPEHPVFRDPASADYTVFECQATVRETGETFRMHTTQVSGGRTGAVCIARLESTATDKSATARFLIARHWRVSTHAWGWEFPRGMGEEHESAEETARREFREETGIDIPIERVNILQRIHADTGVLRDSIAVAEITISGSDLGTNQRMPNQMDNADWELRSVHWVSAETLRAMIANGEITDGITLACWTIHECRFDIA